MNKVIIVMQRELSSYFLSPVAYVIMAVFAAIYGVFFTGLFVTYGVANLQFSMTNLLFALIFIIPIMTMRTLAEERKSGAEELLMTAPVTTQAVVLGKYCALLIALLAMLGLLLIHWGIVLAFTAPDGGPIIASLIGLMLAGAAFIAIGMFTSSLSDNQVISGLLGFAILLIYWLIGWVGGSIGGKIGDLISGLSMVSHYQGFNKGVIDSGSIVFYLSHAAVFLLLTVRQVEARRWR